MQGRAAVRVVGILQQLHAHADTRQGRAELVRGICQQQAMGADERLYQFCCLVEACSQIGHLVAPLHRNPRTEIARPDTFDAFLQIFQPAGQSPNEGIGVEPDTERDDPQENRDTGQGPVPPMAIQINGQPPTVRQVQDPTMALMVLMPAVMIVFVLVR